MNNTVLSVLAYKAGRTYSEVHNVPGNKFFGGMNIADAIGFERGSLEHDAATIAAAEPHKHDLNAYNAVFDRHFSKGTLV